jgi:hypothetical protein
MPTPVTDTATVEVSLGEHVVHVPQGGYYDRYRMRADLDEVAQDPAVPSVDFFRTLPKRVVESPIGPTSTPNYYYAMRLAQIALVAPIGAIRKRLPDGLAALQPAPGLGLVVIVFYSYDVCDVDPYKEATVAIAVRPPRHGGPAELDFVHSRRNHTTYGHSLALPVDTEIARVRGAYGYGLPKWKTEIEFETGATVRGRVANAAGGTDLAIELSRPQQQHHPTGAQVQTTIALSQIDGAWFESKNQINVLAGGSSFLPRDVKITRGSGRLSEELAALRPIRPLSVEVITSGQLVLNMPVPTSVR